MAVRLVVRRADVPGPTSTSPEQVRYEFEQDRLVIGRGASADIRLPALTVSELHATLERTERGYALKDEGSTNGTQVNGSPLLPGRTRSLHEDDELRVGEFLIAFSIGGPLAGLTSPERTVSLAKRLLAESAEALPEQATLHWHVCGETQAARPLPPPPARWLVGRDPASDLHIDDPDVSRQQLELVVDLDGVRVRDLGSKNGITVNDKPMRERQLRDGDRVQLGTSALWLDDPAERALKLLDGRHDVPYVPTARLEACEGPGAPDRDADAGCESPDAGTPAAADPPAAKADKTAAATDAEAGSMGPDAIIYLLAAGVLVASGMGLLWLLSN